MVRIAVLAALFVSGMFALSAPAFSKNRAFASQCQNQSILKRITGKFAWAERNTWRRGFIIDEIRSPRLNYQILNGPTSIRHDHCLAKAIMTDGRVRNIYYMVERGQGFASIGNNVQFCIIGLDPWRVYGAACSTVR